MERMTFDEMLDYASLHTSLLSGESLIINLGQLFIRYDEIRKRKRISQFISNLLDDSGYYKDTDGFWTEDKIFYHLNRYDLL